MAQPTEDPIPLYRTERTGDRGRQQLARRGAKAGHGAVVATSHHDGSRGTLGHAKAADRRSAGSLEASVREVRSSRFSRHFAAGAALRHSAGGPYHASASSASLAEGISHPEDEERLRTQNGGDVEVSGAFLDASTGEIHPAGEAADALARVPAATPAHVPGTADLAANVARSSSAQPQLVQGFGGEIAFTAPAGTGRPGGTRRRNHPAAPPLPEPAPSPSLEERTAITEAAVSPAVLPEIYDHDGRLLMPAPLKGSRDVLVHQNTMADKDGLERIRDDADLERLRADGSLVGFPVSSSLRLNEDLPYNRRCARRWTVLFATEAAQDFYDRFHQPLQVTSAVRTVLYQARLQRVNGNAAATDGDAASPHLTGQAIDFGKRGMSSAQLAWMRAYLLPLRNAGQIDVEEEFRQACFHISVYRSYAVGRAPVHEVAQVRPATARSQDLAGGTADAANLP